MVYGGHYSRVHHVLAFNLDHIFTSTDGRCLFSTADFCYGSFFALTFLLQFFSCYDFLLQLLFAMTFFLLLSLSSLTWWFSIWIIFQLPQIAIVDRRTHSNCIITFRLLSNSSYSLGYKTFTECTSQLFEQWARSKLNSRQNSKNTYCAVAMTSKKYIAHTWRHR